MAHALMSTAILDAMKDEIRARMGSQFKTVEDYGGQFDEEEVPSKSFVAPAAFTTCLGWRKSPASGKYLGSKYVWEARFAVFIVTKSATRPQRMRDAMVRAEVLSRVFQSWVYPQCTGRPEGLMAENLYNRKLDAKGLTVWMVAWWQEAEFEGVPTPADLPELEVVDITSDPTIAPQTTPGELPDLIVEHEIKGVRYGSET
ncbi:phage protein Gp37 [Burkholderia cenocepacia]|uniref:phage protein Gp37 n=1 Tax=Burkholderia cenocepacia TaxID=95486 RepID=UPI001588341A|nr:phage protein Gp37 [Burkholderia cenocepacia]